ncbi:uncharacterized protein N7483_012131 [Penicillium malachiteum]|uniref:uncharacterized protein n=1 Tax=Penicillium malachiteum TaxID=1324776 RepID=UPI0025470E05|nr:uncharacterized protein N7483_012131 [Penicillium malachiteum]KAJ5714950.1 hypothetical protein N7483_012131 [Penicillium malachiteum]
MADPISEHPSKKPKITDDEQARSPPPNLTIQNSRFRDALQSKEHPFSNDKVRDWEDQPDQYLSQPPKNDNYLRKLQFKDVLGPADQPDENPEDMERKPLPNASSEDKMKTEPNSSTESILGKRRRTLSLSPETPPSKSGWRESLSPGRIPSPQGYLRTVLARHVAKQARTPVEEKEELKRRLALPEKAKLIVLAQDEREKYLLQMYREREKLLAKRVELEQMLKDFRQRTGSEAKKIMKETKEAYLKLQDESSKLNDIVNAELDFIKSQDSQLEQLVNEPVQSSSPVLVPHQGKNLFEYVWSKDNQAKGSTSEEQSESGEERDNKEDENDEGSDEGSDGGSEGDSEGDSEEGSEEGSEGGDAKDRSKDESPSEGGQPDTNESGDDEADEPDTNKSKDEEADDTFEDGESDLQEEVTGNRETSQSADIAPSESEIEDVTMLDAGEETGSHGSHKARSPSDIEMRDASEIRSLQARTTASDVTMIDADRSMDEAEKPLPQRTTPSQVASYLRNWISGKKT